MNKKRTILYSFIVAIIVISIISLSRTSLQFDPKEIRTWILSFGFFAPLIYIVIYTIRPLLFFPASILSIAGGLAFGALMGTLYTIIGATLGAVLSFIIARKLGKNVTNKEWKGNFQKIQTQLEKNGFYYVLFLRFIPVLNFDLISYIAGVSSVRLSAFFFGTLLGIIPGTFAYNFLGNSFISGSPKVILTASIVFILIMIIPIFIKKRIEKVK
ncbi:TVP38/TMEM64 family protein [Lottiidibacillus patelloidae]|uniref:TVP38/TMEM64 family membrane protein n=1 Tax=Lottiidibacillus patelloidae TaxID=2670334 RepID=A0A263BVC9_9BACI|nr:TVP38/TMEM64 family protein [Lottiidibacillus patelloidae]OZM57512.1 TVP38/TMEM64 family protein [Lottiidibacillus patelloidae]